MANDPGMSGSAGVDDARQGGLTSLLAAAADVTLLRPTHSPSDQTASPTTPGHADAREQLPPCAAVGVCPDSEATTSTPRVASLPELIGAVVVSSRGAHPSGSAASGSMDPPSPIQSPQNAGDSAQAYHDGSVEAGARSSDVCDGNSDGQNRGNSSSSCSGGIHGVSEDPAGREGGNGRGGTAFAARERRGSGGGGAVTASGTGGRGSNAGADSAGDCNAGRAAAASTSGGSGAGGSGRSGGKSGGGTDTATAGGGGGGGSGSNGVGAVGVCATSAASGGVGRAGGGGGPTGLSLEPSSSLLEQVSREVIRKLRLAASADKAEDRHVVCEELFADITCALDASAQAALLGPAAAAPYVPGSGGPSSAPPSASSSAAAAGLAAAGAGVVAAGGGSGGGGGQAEGSVAGGVALPAAASAERGGRSRGRLYYEVLAVHYATRGAADSARALLHLCQLLWDTPWVAPIYALLLHRFLLLPRDVGNASSPGPTTSPSPPSASSSALSSLPASPALSFAAAAAKKMPYTPGAVSYTDSRVKHLNVLAHGARQLLLGDVHSGLSRFQPLWVFLTLEVVGLGAGASSSEAVGLTSESLPAAWPPATAVAGVAGPALPPVASIDSVPATARPWLLAVAAAFLPYYCLDEQFAELARRFPPPVPMEATGIEQVSSSAAAAGLDFLLVEVTDVLGRINSEVGLLKYLRSLRALARPPPPPPPPPPPLTTATTGGRYPGQQPSPSASPAEAAEQQPATTAAEPGVQPGVQCGAPEGSTSAASTATAPLHGEGGGGGGGGDDAGDGGSSGSGHSTDPASTARVVRWGGVTAGRPAGLQQPGRRRSPAATAPPAAYHPLAGLPTITKLRLQNELYSLTSGGGPRYAPPEVRKAAFQALDALFPGGRSLRWLVRWASRTLHLEWLEGDVEDPWVVGGWLGWIYWPLHWCTALYGRLLLALFQLLYGMVVWRPSLRQRRVRRRLGQDMSGGGVERSEGESGEEDDSGDTGAVGGAGVSVP